MGQNRNTHSLFAALQGLYTKLGRVLVKIRMRTYRMGIKKNTRLDITSVLAKQIDEFVFSGSKEKESEGDIKQQSSAISYTKTDKKKESENSSGIETEFVRHLKNRKKRLITNHSLGDKLKSVAWEHLHSAIRYAKQGDIDAAKLHSDIAGNALEEASYYLGNKDYSDLIFQIEQYFIDSQKDKKQEV